MIATNIRRLSVYLVLAFASISGALVWWQVLDAQTLATRQDNPQVIATRRSLPRGSIFDAQGRLLASSVVADGISRRTYTDPAFTHLLGYASLRFGATGVERAWDDLLTGRTDPNPLRDLVNDILDRQPNPHDLTLTIDQRLQDFAAAQLGADRGAVVAIDPRTGAILALVSNPSYDATGFSGDPATAQAAFDAVAGTADNPFLDRSRQGHYTPGSIMKILTAAAALDSGAITPETTFEDQPSEEVDGFVVSGFTIREHDLGNVAPALWDLSPAMQVSSNIYFAHVGLELGADRYMDYAHRFGFCAGLRIGTDARGLPVDPSYVSARADDGCAPFRDDVELASAAFGQAAVSVTPLQMALLAATIANDGIVPQPYLVRDLRSHAATPTEGPSQSVLEAYGGGRGDPLRDHGRRDGWQDRHRGARPRPQAALVVHRLRAGPGWRHPLHRDRGHRRGRRQRLGACGSDRGRRDGGVAQAGWRRSMKPGAHEPTGGGLGYCSGRAHTPAGPTEGESPR